MPASEWRDVRSLSLCVWFCCPLDGWQQSTMMDAVVASWALLMHHGEGDIEG